jgi:hypothetical protein
MMRLSYLGLLMPIVACNSLQDYIQQDRGLSFRKDYSTENVLGRTISPNGQFSDNPIVLIIPGDSYGVPNTRSGKDYTFELAAAADTNGVLSKLSDISLGGDFGINL